MKALSPHSLRIINEDKGYNLFQKPKLEPRSARQSDLSNKNSQYKDKLVLTGNLAKDLADFSSIKGKDHLNLIAIVDIMVQLKKEEKIIYSC